MSKIILIAAPWVVESEEFIFDVAKKVSESVEKCRFLIYSNRHTGKPTNPSVAKSDDANLLRLNYRKLQSFKV